MTELTLKQALAILIEQNRFSEVLDRLSELADSIAQTSDEPTIVQDWNAITATLETLTRQTKLAESRVHHIEGSPGHD
jgi:hypothetical protein